MFYTVLFLLTLFNFVKAGKSFIKENVVIKDGKKAEISKDSYLSFGITALFHVMVLSVCMLPSLLW